MSTGCGETSPGAASPQDGGWAEVPRRCTHASVTPNSRLTGLTPGSLQENRAPLIRDEILGTGPVPTDHADAPSMMEGGWAD